MSSYLDRSGSQRNGSIPAGPGVSPMSFPGLGDLPTMDSAQQALAWQQGQYLTDSGIHSGMSTRRASVSSRQGVLESVEETPENVANRQAHLSAKFPQPVYGSQSADVSDMTHGCPGQAPVPLYPAPLDGGMQVNPGAIFQPLFADTCDTADALFRDAVCNLIDLQDTRHLMSDAIPCLASALTENDHVVVGQAATMIHQLSKKETSRGAIISAPGMVHTMIRCMITTTDDETLRCMAGSIHHLSYEPKGLVLIFKSGGIQALVKLLSSDLDTVLYYVITTLHNLLLHQDGSKDAVRQAGGVRQMVALLRSSNCNVKFLAITTDCLQLLAFSNLESKLAILECNGPEELVRIMQTNVYEKLLWTTSRVLKVLSVCSKNKLAIVEAGGMNALAIHLGHRSQRLVQNCLWTLRNLSDAATKLDNLECLLQKLVHLLLSPDSHIVSCVAGILSNLTCNNQKNKAFVCHSGGVEALLQIIRCAVDQEDITEPAVCALRHLTSRNAEAEMAQNAVRLRGGIPILVQLLQPPSRWLLIKAVMGLIRNLALLPANIAPLRECDIISKIAQIMKRTYQDLQKATGDQNPGGRVVVDGVRMDEVLEGSVGTLHIMAHEQQSRSIITGLGCIPLLIQMLYLPYHVIQRVVTGLLCELTLESESAAIIEKEGAVFRLTKLVQSPCETTASHASKIIIRLNDRKSHMRQPFSTDAMGSSFHDQAGNSKQMLCVEEYDTHDSIYGISHQDIGPSLSGPGTVVHSPAGGPSALGYGTGLSSGESQLMSYRGM